VRRAVTAVKTSSWEASSLLLLQAASAHCRCLVVSEFFNAFNDNDSLSPSLRHLLSLLLQLLASSWILEDSAPFLRHAGINFEQLDRVAVHHAELLNILRLTAVHIVDSFDFRDEVLDSSLGAYDGWVYHRLFHAAVGSPLNQTGAAEEAAGYLSNALEKCTMSKL